MANAPSADAALWRDRARAYRAEQKMVEADGAIALAATLDPEDRLTAFLHAQSRYELGYPATELFAAAVALWPGNLDVLRNHALALASEGDPARAEALLDRALLEHPDWLDGQRVLAGLRWTAGLPGRFDAGFARAAREHPDHAGLWRGWFSTVAQQRDWPAARAILRDAENRLGRTRALVTAEAFVACETGDLGETERLLDELRGVSDDFLAICRMRYHLRAGRPEAIEAEAMLLTQTSLAGQVWPYPSVAWRLLGDPRREWLDGDPALVGHRDAGLSPSELAELAEVLRGLHTAQAAYAEQSVRGGTQTDRSVLLRHEPILLRTRECLLARMREFVAGLPPHDPAHPLLGCARENLRISGSWSVRLGASG